MLRVRRSAVVLVFTAACGGGTKSDSPLAAASAPRAAASGNASAEEVAKERRGGVSCPAAISMPRASGAPVDDILGVRPGMPADEAARIVLCSNPMLIVTVDSSNRFNIDTHGTTIRQGFEATFAKARVEKSSKEIMADMQQEMIDRGANRVRRTVNPGESAWTVGLIGLPGDERVTDIAREEWYASGQEPARADVVSALKAKYGAPTWEQDNGTISQLRWAHGPDGARVEGGVGGRCSTNPYRASSVSYAEDCGVVVEAAVQGVTSNAGLASNVQVRAVDQGAAYQRITSTAASLAQKDGARQAQEVEAARKRGVGKM